MNEQMIEQFKIAMGALGETAWMFYSNCKRLGFTNDQAMQLTSEVVRGIVNGTRNNQNNTGV